MLLIGLALSVSADEIDRVAYRADLDFLASAPRSPGSAHHGAAADLCAQRLDALGFDVSRQTGRNDDGVPYTNIIGRRLGQRRPERQVIVSAHYDSVPQCPGADDNASGVAGVLEAARLLARERYEYTVTAICWDAEEQRLAGSAAFVEDFRKDKGGRIEMVYVFEMIGYTRTEPGTQKLRPGLGRLFPVQYGHLEDNEFRGDFILLVGDAGARKAMRSIRERIVDRGGKAVVLQWNLARPVPPDFMRSDHYPFWLIRTPAIMITDTAELRNPNYHCRDGEDTAATLDDEFAAKVIDATVYSARKVLRPVD